MRRGKRARNNVEEIEDLRLMGRQWVLGKRLVMHLNCGLKSNRRGARGKGELIRTIEALLGRFVQGKNVSDRNRKSGNLGKKETGGRGREKHQKSRGEIAKRLRCEKGDRGLPLGQKNLTKEGEHEKDVQVRHQKGVGR